MTKPSPQDIHYEVITQEDENGDILLPIPPILLKELGWKETDEIAFNVDTTGQIILSKVT
jgi:bifunctional DNA-binding transcriptional regulator/antitoxin component of YhaV-PrlF toxin-antitoxin module